MVFFVWYGIPDIGLEKGGTSAHTGVKPCPVDTVLARGRVLLVCGCRLIPVDASQSVIHEVRIPIRKGGLFLFVMR